MSTKKKIGIITNWETNDNYGQQLQCWALQHFLRERGYDAFLIRQYAWPSRWNQKKKGVKRIKQLVKNSLASFLYFTKLAYRPFFYKRFAFCLDVEACRRLFPLFRVEHLQMSKLYNTPEMLMENPPEADVYITGSDQIWNYELDEGPLKNYFLQFGNSKVKRIAYAPSFGHSSIPEEAENRIKQYLKIFNAISIRESSMVQVIKDMGYNATAVLDPTMLLEAKDYLQLSSNIKGKESVFIYSMNYASSDDISFGEIEEFAKCQNLPIIVTPGSGYLPARELFEGVEYSYATISQWIQHIANAKMVVTASFHGIVFAILFHRPFIYTPLKGEHANSNNRVLDLLNNLGLREWVWDGSRLNNDDFIKQIDWEKVDVKLGKLRQYSITYLLNAING